MGQVRIVIANGDLDLLQRLSRQLEEAGYEAVTCRDGNDALNLVAQRDAVILLAACEMPGLSGLEVCERIRSWIPEKTVYVILLTRNADTAHVTVGLEAGADDYLAESAPHSELLARIRAGERILRLLAHRKRAEQELRATHAKTEQLLSSIPSILIGVNEKDCVIRWNEPAEEAFGVAARDVLGSSFEECGIRWDWTTIGEYVKRCRTEKRSVHPDEIRYQRPDGTEGFLGLTVNPIRWDTQHPLGFLIVAADITERRILQSQLTQAQKLESIGQLAAGIAHEINTPTQFVGDNARFLRDAFVDLEKLLLKYGELQEAARSGPVSPELLNEVEAVAKQADVAYLMEEIPAAISQSLEGIERVARIVRAMKDFSHPGGAEMALIDLNKAIDSTITVARNEWKYVADLVADFDPELPPVPCLVGDFNQVILNMIVNAAHAIADVVGDGSAGKGKITITTRSLGDQVEVRIQDTGTGIPEGIRSKVFDPFFTTKEVGKGTGQGLAIAHSVVTEKHGGTLTVESEEGKGATFIIRLPCEPGTSEQLETVPHEEAHSVC